MSQNTTIGLNSLTSTTITSITNDSTPSSSLFTTIVNNLNQSTTTYPDGVYNFTWVIPTFPPTIFIPPPAVVDNGTTYYSISLYSYVIVLAVIVMAALVAKLAMQRRHALARAAARQRIRARQQNATVSTISTAQLSNEDGNIVGVPKTSDLPPAYDEVMKTYLNAKLQLHTEEEGAVGGMTAAISSATIETELDTMTSTIDLSTTIAAGAPATTMTTATATCQEPPSYESTFSSSNISNTRDSIV